MCRKTRSTVYCEKTSRSVLFSPRRSSILTKSGAFCVKLSRIVRESSTHIEPLPVHRLQGRGVVRSRLWGREGSRLEIPIPLKIRRVWGMLYAKRSGQTSSRWCGAKIPTLAGLPKKGVMPGEDQREESLPTSMWRTGFIRYNKMIQALFEQGQYF
ncbi:hypothetical protein AVEN_21089-1 [Araneus ventricosus]|uniref:Uncharacterized protein n=1 Tax=Araneus ventricosus TaxID=182803 RepID=A0A4Y2VE60_ARAVE|nr:hypothetical protein AVEN_21089-1 [Araneus ventricosus]